MPGDVLIFGPLEDVIRGVDVSDDRVKNVKHLCFAHNPKLFFQWKHKRG